MDGIDTSVRFRKSKRTWILDSSFLNGRWRIQRSGYNISIREQDITRITIQNTWSCEINVLTCVDWNFMKVGMIACEVRGTMLNWEYMYLL